MILAVLLATVTLVCGAPGIGRFALTTALWSVITIVGIAWTERRHTRLSDPGGI